MILSTKVIKLEFKSVIGIKNWHNIIGFVERYMAKFSIKIMRWFPPIDWLNVILMEHQGVILVKGDSIECSIGG